MIIHVIAVSLCTDESFPSIAIAAIPTVLSIILLLLILIGIITIVCAAVNKNQSRRKFY